MSADHEHFIRECFALARSAAARGDHPFGALLVVDGQAVLTAENTVCSEHDVTRHAELNLVSRASRELGPDVLARSTLYTSTEPCAMCTGAIFWAGIPTIVYGCAAVTLHRIAGGDFLIPCRDILARASRPTQVIGPLLDEEGAAIHGDYWPHRV